MDLFDFAEQQTSKTQAQYLELVAKVKHHNELYYKQAKPEISDAEYDRLYLDLEQLEAEHPEWVTPESPTQQVGNDLSEGFTKMQHELPMLSIDDIFEKKTLDGEQSDVDLVAFYQRLSKSIENPQLCVEPKIDGCAVTLMYREGKLIYAATRGDGNTGDNITANMLTIKSIPQQLPTGAPELLEVRGEVYMRNSVFQKLNAKREAEGLSSFANPRNTAAGSIKMLDSAEVAQRQLDFIAHGLGQYEGETLHSAADFINMLDRMSIPYNKPVILTKSLQELRAAVQKINKVRHEFDYGTDGAVIKLLDFEQREQLGATARAPRWAAAFKFLPEQKETTLKAITIQVGRTGVLTPVAELEPVLLSGSTVSRATLHNQDEIERKGIHIGDTVLIEKAGEIIPSIVKVNESKRPANARPYHLFDAVNGLCPSCQAPISQEEGQVAWRCTNLTCPAQAVMRTVHLCRRSALNIDNIGESVAEALVRDGLIQSPLDLFKLNLKQLATLNLGTEEEPRTFGEKNATKAINALEAAKKLPLDLWLSAIGIQGVGVEMGRKLAEHHQDLHDLASSGFISTLGQAEQLANEYNIRNPKARANKDADKEQLEREREPIRDEFTQLIEPYLQRSYIELIPKPNTIELRNPYGAVVTRNILTYFKSSAGRDLISILNHFNINPQSANYTENKAEQGGVLAELNFALTGTMSRPRPEIAELIKQAGGKVPGAINAKTNYLVAGNGGGSKRTKAEKLGITIIDEAQLMEMLNTASTKQNEE